MDVELMKSILLISAMNDMDISKWVNTHVAQPEMRRAFAVPLGLGTIAALTPERYEVAIWDESVQGPVNERNLAGRQFDLVGVTAYSGQLSRARELGQLFRQQRIPVVIGGPGVTSDPEGCRTAFDVLFLGESEETWPKFLAEWEAGTNASQYEPSHLPDMSLSPKPRWDSIAHLLPASYLYGTVQTNRGCPHNCEFCSEWIRFGRKVRTKSTRQILEEVSEFGRRGLKNVLFCTDNFYGAPQQARELAREILALNESYDPPMRFNTELSLNVSRDDELLRNLADAGFGTVFVGVESSSTESLRETRKRANINDDLAAQCRKIAANAMVVQASMIVGFDNDGPDIFDRHFRFLQEAFVPVPRLNVLSATPGTDLHKRLLGEGRVLDVKRTFAGQSEGISEACFSSNILFKGMSRADLYAGMIRLHELVWDWESFEVRMRGFIDNITRLPQRKQNTKLQQVVASLRKTLPGVVGANPEVIERVFCHAETAAPQLMVDVASCLMLMCWEVTRLPSLKETLQRQVEIEKRVESKNGYVIRS
jgi:radical SAM superfamily enzyme YgiQ (UPF0313 family)